jgi:hypothetical protein
MRGLQLSTLPITPRLKALYLIINNIREKKLKKEERITHLRNPLKVELISII